MNTKETEKLIAKHLSGEATPQENQAFRQWINSNNQNKTDFNKIALSYQLSKGKTLHSQKSKVFANIQQKIYVDHEIRIDKKQNSINRRLKAWMSVAASIIVLISLGLFYYTNSNSSLVQESVHEQLVVKSNPAGQKSKVFLPDGSIVWLNSESSISYESEFNDSSRHIHLNGEAFFEVKKDNARPFVVYSGTVSTTALGTAFNINAFNKNNITVSLTHGKVNVKANHIQGSPQGLIINAGEGVVYNADNKNPINKIIINPSTVMLWRDGLLHLKNSSLQETITKLERWYGVEIKLNNKPIEMWNANGLFDNEYLENVLRSLSFSQDFNYEIKGKQVLITFKNEMPM